MATIIDIINRLRADGSTEYVDRVPLATRDNITAVGNPILTYSPVQNEFLTNLIGKIALTVIEKKTFNNPMAVLKKGMVPLGSDIEEIFTRLATGQQFDGTGANLLTQYKPEIEVMYHRRNRQGQYPVTVSKQQLQTAFTSWGKMEEFLSGIVNTLYSGDNYDEFIMMKNLVADAVIAEKIGTSVVAAITSEATAKAFVKAVRSASALMQFPSSGFNKFADVTGHDPIVTWCPKEDQILLIRTDILTEIDVEVLAVAFNMEKTTLMSRLMELDNFGAATTVYALLCDKSLFQVRDTNMEMSEFYNPKALAWTYYWNHWQNYSISLFANAVAFKVADIVIAADTVLTAIAGGTTAAPTYANAAAVIVALRALYPYVYFDSGAHKVPVTTFVDTDTYNAAAAASYTFTATLGTLPYGVSNSGTKKATVEIVVVAA